MIFKNDKKNKKYIYVHEFSVLVQHLSLSSWYQMFIEIKWIRN